MHAENQEIFAKNCPKREKPAKLLEQTHIHAEDTPFSDAESPYSLDDEYSPKALVVMGYSTTEEDSNSESVASDLEVQAIYTSQPTLISLASPIPVAQVHILLDSYSKPTLVIALFDTEVVATIIHPKILPKEFWLPRYQMFHTENGETFPTRKLNLTRVICFRMGKTNMAKTPPGDFMVITPENSLLSQQAVTSKGIPVPYTNL